MFSKDFEYTGYDGKPKKDTYWFNLTEAELYEIDLSSIHGFNAEMTKLLKEERTKEIVDAFKGIILSSVGVISADGRKFLKSDEIREDFYRSKAYSMLFVELVSSGEKVAEFLKGAIPDEIRQKMDENENGQAEQGNMPIQDIPVLPKRTDA